MRTGHGSAVLGLLLLLGACGDAATGPEEDVRFFPLTVGDTWTYAPEDPLFGDAVQWRVTERTGDTVTVLRPPGPSHPGPVTLIDGGREIDLLLPGGDAVAFYRFAPGDSWVRHDPWECDAGSTWAAVEEAEPITTSAGTFERTLRLERRTAATCSDAGTMMEWWAPGVGLVRWDELNVFAGGPVTFELVTWSLEEP
jgi:hypothetical protein